MILDTAYRLYVQVPIVARQWLFALCFGPRPGLAPLLRVVLARTGRGLPCLVSPPTCLVLPDVCRASRARCPTGGVALFPRLTTSRGPTPRWAQPMGGPSGGRDGACGHHRLLPPPPTAPTLAMPADLVRLPTAPRQFWRCGPASKHWRLPGRRFRSTILGRRHRTPTLPLGGGYDAP